MKKTLFLIASCLIFSWVYAVYSAVVSSEDQIVTINSVTLEPDMAFVVYKISIKGFDEFAKTDQFGYESALTSQVYNEAMIFINKRRKSQ